MSNEDLEAEAYFFVYICATSKSFLTVRKKYLQEKKHQCLIFNPFLPRGALRAYRAFLKMVTDKPFRREVCMEYILFREKSL